MNPHEAREEHILPLVTSPAVSGRVLVLGHSPFAVTEFVHNPAVTEVFYVPGVELARQGEGLDSKAARQKLRVIERWMSSPAGVQRRDLGVDHVDFLFVDMPSGPWDLGREEFIRGRSREFRPRAVGYRYQELDVAAHWIAAGCSLDDISARAFATYAAATGIILAPADNEAAQRCATMAADFTGVAR